VEGAADPVAPFSWGMGVALALTFLGEKTAVPIFLAYLIVKVRVLLSAVCDASNWRHIYTRRVELKFIHVPAAIALFGLVACAETAVQPMSKDTFKIDTRTDSDCGAVAARNIAFKAAAIEVIRKGGDKFIITGDNTDSDFWGGTYTQGMVVKMIPDKSPEARNALSARETLGSDWQNVVAKGVPQMCV
jgi:hypothetical protein